MAMRIKPNIGKKESLDASSKKDDPTACVLIPITILVGYFVLLAIVRTTSGNGSRLDQFVCYGILLTIVIMSIVGSLKDRNEQQDWKDRSVSAEAIIVNRKHSAGGIYEINELGETRYSRPRQSMMLKLPNQMIVNVTVSESTYAKLANRETVRIYYQPDSPSTFLLEDEI